MEYKRAPELASPMLPKIDYKTKCSFTPDLYESGPKKGRCNKSISTFHSTCVRPAPRLGGIHNSEIEKIYEQVEKDINSTLACAATFGVHMKGINRHCHAHEILEDNTLTGVTSKRFTPLIADTRQSFQRVDDDGNLVGKRHVTVFCSQPPQKDMPTWRAYTHLAYPWKEKAEGYNTLESFIEAFVAFDGKDTERCRSFGLFGKGDAMGGDSSDSIENKRHFGTAIWNHWQKELAKSITHEISINNDLHRLATEFLESIGREASCWTTEAAVQAKIIYLMLYHEGECRYILNKHFFNKKMKEFLALQKGGIGYKEALHDAILERVNEGQGMGGATITTREKTKQITALKLRNQELATQHQELNEKITRLEEVMKKKEKEHESWIAYLQEKESKLCQEKKNVLAKLAKRNKEVRQAVMELMDEHPMKTRDEDVSWNGEWETLGPSDWGAQVNSKIRSELEKKMEAAVDEWRKRPHFELVGPDDAKPWAVAAPAAPAAKRQKIN